MTGADPARDDASILLREAALFGRHLTGRALADELAHRYAAACRARGLVRGAGDEERVVALALRRPRTLPFLDAALALTGRRTLLRRKLLVMAAVVETAPEHAGLFLDPPPGRARTVTRLALLGLRTAALALGGCVVLAVARARAA